MTLALAWSREITEVITREPVCSVAVGNVPLNILFAERRASGTFQGSELLLQGAACAGWCAVILPPDRWTDDIVLFLRVHSRLRTCSNHTDDEQLSPLSR